MNMKDVLLQIPESLKESWAQIKQPGIVHNSNVCLLANESFANLLGYVRKEELEGLQIGEFFSPWPAWEVRLGRREVLGRRADGSTVDLELMTLPFYSGDEMLYQSLVRDISELRSWEDKLLQSERLSAMGRLAGEIAHEINNPLGGILLYANLLKEDMSDKRAAMSNVEKIVKLATRCRIIAKGLLNFGKSSSRSYAPVDLNQVVTEMFSLIEDHNLFKEIKVNIELDKDIPHLMGDKGQLEQVVLNLIINGAEAIKGQGHLYISTRYDSGSKYVILAVRDTGIGIPEEIRHRIFEPFFTSKKPGRGTGLGLSITHGIVQRHRGTITIESEVGSGTLFEVRLPVLVSG